MKKLIVPALTLAYGAALVMSLLCALQPGPAIFEFVTHSTGTIVFAILLYGLIRYISYIIKIKRLRKRDPDKASKIPKNIFANVKNSFLEIYTQSQSPWRIRLAEGGKLLILTTTAAYTLVLMEWIFQVTKVSFMNNLNLGMKLAIFLIAGLFLAACGMAINIVLLLAEFILRPVHLSWLARCLNIAIPTALFTSMLILWLDTFTYTVFRFGILATAEWSRVIYGVLIVMLFLSLYHWLLKLFTKRKNTQSIPHVNKWLRLVVISLLAVSFVLAITQMTHQSASASSDINEVTAHQNLPNIILIGGDGLSAKNMSLYGYKRATTPNLEALGEVSLVAENAFTNSSKTYGSIISMLTGKYPTRTGVIFPPDILNGIDSNQHLPGILKKIGYTTAQIGVNVYVDANAWNIHNAFDRINQRTIEGNVLFSNMRKLGYEYPAYFVIIIEDRLANRLIQALYINTVENPFASVADSPQWSGDRQRIDDLLNLIENTPSPLFVQVHLVETHGSTYEPAIRNFSVGIEQTEKYMIDFYDDTILSFDAYFGELLDALKASGQFDQTLLILYSDHAFGFQTTERIPLLFHFPADQFAGRITTNVQNLDIAPTILDYLGVPIPEWMDGESILQFDTQVREPIFSVRMNNGDDIEYPETNTGPFETDNHQFSILQVFYCQWGYHYDLAAQEKKIIRINKYVAPCEDDIRPGWEQIDPLADQFLTSQGYDPSILP